MTSDLYWVESPTPGRLAVFARPRGGDWLPDEVAGWLKEREQSASIAGLYGH